MPDHLELHGVRRTVSKNRLAPGFVERELRLRWVERGSAYNEDITNAQRGTRGLRAVMTHSDFGETHAVLLEDAEPDADAVLDEILTCMGDVLCDMRHLLDSLPVDVAPDQAWIIGQERWDQALRKCEMHYRAELFEEAEADRGD